MPADHTRRLGLATRAAFVAVACIVLSHTLARAQSSSSSAARAAARAAEETRQRMLWEPDKVNREKRARVPDTLPDYEEVAEEFKQLQLVNRSLAGVADPQATLDYARVRKASAEVRKRAARLKEYLVLPEAEGAQRPEKSAEILTPETLRAAVGRLDALVNSFAWNPVFQRPDVVDLELSSKAGRDLAGILILSEQIRKGADELGRATRSGTKK